MIYKDRECALQWGTYETGQIALMLIDLETGGPVVTASVDIFDSTLTTDEIIISGYNVYKALLEEGIIDKTYRRIITQYICYPVCRLAPVALSQIQSQTLVKHF